MNAGSNKMAFLVVRAAFAAAAGAMVAAVSWLALDTLAPTTPISEVSPAIPTVQKLAEPYQDFTRSFWPMTKGYVKANEANKMIMVVDGLDADVLKAIAIGEFCVALLPMHDPDSVNVWTPYPGPKIPHTATTLLPGEDLWGYQTLFLSVYRDLLPREQSISSPFGPREDQAPTDPPTPEAIAKDKRARQMLSEKREAIAIQQIRLLDALASAAERIEHPKFRALAFSSILSCYSEHGDAQRAFSAATSYGKAVAAEAKRETQAVGLRDPANKRIWILLLSCSVAACVFLYKTN